jgi:hypothetical protein
VGGGNGVAEGSAAEAGGIGAASVNGPFWPQPDSIGSTPTKEPVAVITTMRGTKLERRFNIV